MSIHGDLTQIIGLLKSIQEKQDKLQQQQDRMSADIDKIRDRLNKIDSANSILKEQVSRLDGNVGLLKETVDGYGTTIESAAREFEHAIQRAEAAEQFVKSYTRPKRADLPSSPALPYAMEEDEHTQTEPAPAPDHHAQYSSHPPADDT